MSWKVVYHYADDNGEDAAQMVFNGISRAYDRAARLELVSPEGEVVDTIYKMRVEGLAPCGRGEFMLPKMLQRKQDSAEVKAVEALTT